MGGKAGGYPKAGYTMHWNRKAAIVCLLKPQLTCQTETVIDNSLTLNINAPTGFMVDCHQIDKVTKMMPVKADLAICSSVIGVPD